MSELSFMTTAHSALGIVLTTDKSYPVIFELSCLASCLTSLSAPSEISRTKEEICFAIPTAKQTLNKKKLIHTYLLFR